MFMEDGALQSFDEAIGPKPTWLCGCMCDFKVLAGQIEVSLELAASVGEHIVAGEDEMTISCP